MNELLRPIEDRETLARIDALRAQITEGPWHLDSGYASARAWAAVPVEKGRHVEFEDAGRIARAMRRASKGPCYAIATEPLGGGPTCYAVECSEGALAEFSRTCAGLNYLILPPDVAFALLFTSEDYNLYAGPRGFVEEVLGRPIGEALLAFRQYAEDPWWEGRMMDVYERYAATG